MGQLPDTTGIDFDSIRGAVTQIEWVDWTAITILGVFFLLGLVHGFVWQASRILSLVLGYVAAGMYGPTCAGWIQPWFSADTPLQGVPLYIAYVMVFVAALVTLSLIAYVLQKLVRRTGLSFYDRIGGGFLGFATGAFVMIALLSVIMMFVPDDFALKKTAQQSKAMAFSRKTLATLGTLVPEPMQLVFGVDEPNTEPSALPETGQVPTGFMDQGGPQVVSGR